MVSYLDGTMIALVMYVKVVSEVEGTCWRAAATVEDD